MFRTTYYLTVLVVILGGSTQFYSYNVVNPEQEVLTNWLNETFAQRNDGVPPSAGQLSVVWSVIVSSIAMGAVCGSLFMRTLAEFLGRKNALIANGVINVFGALCQYAARVWASPEILVVGRFILGANLGLASGLVPMYLMEISPMRYRGMAATVHQVAVAFADLFSFLMGMPEILGAANNWQFAFAFPGLPAFLMCCILPFCPESPKYTLITKGKHDSAIRDMHRLVNNEEATHMFDTLLHEAAIADKSSGSYKELFTRSDLRYPLMLSAWMMVAQQFTGCAAVFAYSTDMFISAQISPNLARYCTLVLGLVYFIFTCSAAFLIERIGRRALSLFQLGTVTIALSCIMVVTYIQQYYFSPWTQYAAVLALVLYMCAYGVGSPIPWMITGEIFPTKFRSAAITVAIFLSWFLLFFISLTYLPFKQIVGVSFSFLPFIVVSGFSTVIIYCFLPETMNKHSDDIVKEIAHRSQSFSVAAQARSLKTRRRASASGRIARTSTTGSHKKRASDERTALLLTDSQLERYKYLSLSELTDCEAPPTTPTFYDNKIAAL